MIPFYGPSGSDFDHLNEAISNSMQESQMVSRTLGMIQNQKRNDQDEIRFNQHQDDRARAQEIRKMTLERGADYMEDLNGMDDDDPEASDKLSESFLNLPLELQGDATLRAAMGLKAQSISAATKRRGEKIKGMKDLAGLYNSDAANDPRYRGKAINIVHAITAAETAEQANEAMELSKNLRVEKLSSDFDDDFREMNMPGVQMSKRSLSEAFKSEYGVDVESLGIPEGDWSTMKPSKIVDYMNASTQKDGFNGLTTDNRMEQFDVLGVDIKAKRTQRNTFLNGDKQAMQKLWVESQQDTAERLRRIDDSIIKVKADKDAQPEALQSLVSQKKALIEDAQKNLGEVKQYIDSGSYNSEKSMRAHKTLMRPTLDFSNSKSDSKSDRSSTNSNINDS